MMHSRVTSGCPEQTLKVFLRNFEVLCEKAELQTAEHSVYICQRTKG